MHVVKHTGLFLKVRVQATCQLQNLSMTSNAALKPLNRFHTH
jgi:hypothetical protein